MKRVLLVDPSVEVQNQLTKEKDAELELHFAASASEARQFLGRSVVDLIVMELDLPDGSGFSLCQEIKGNEILSAIPIVFLTARVQLTDRIEGFKAGADDYVIKPFDSLELILRIDARLRKSQLGTHPESSIQLGNLTLSVPYQKAAVKEAGIERDLKLTPTEFRLLYFFIKNEGAILTREQLLSTVWNGDVQVLTRTIDKHISTLKKKLGSQANSIQSIHSRGYRFSLFSSPAKEQESVLATL